MTAPPSPRPARRPPSVLAWVAVAVLVVAAAVVLVTEPVTGPHLAHVYGSHGVDAGDLLALPFLLGAGGLGHWAWQNRADR